MKVVESRGIAIITVLLLFIGSAAEAQQSNKLPRIGYISGTLDVRNAGFEALRRGLRDLGCIEAKNILIEYRYTEGKRERISEFVTELLKLPVDVLVSPTPSVIRAARDATRTVPIVIVTTSDPVGSGIVDSLAHPGRNITGVTRFTRELSGKRLELLKEAVPKLSRVGLLLGADATTNLAAKQYETAAHALHLALQPLGVRSPNPDLTGAFQAAIKARVGALVIVRATALNRTRQGLPSLPKTSDCRPCTKSARV